MRILTYNIARLTPFKNLDAIQKLLLSQDADVIVLTESDTRISLQGYAVQHTNYANYYEWYGIKGEYKPTERCVSIFTKHTFIEPIRTFNSEVAVAWKINIDGVEIIVYGMLLGMTGKNDKNFNLHADRMQRDWVLLAKKNNLCIAGDFNISFADNSYTNKIVRTEFSNFYISKKLTHLTAGLPNCVDHIVISQSILLTENKAITKQIAINTFAEQKKLSDHAGVMVTIK